MTEITSRLQRKLMTAACILITGLVAEATTLYWSNPTSFLFFVAVGGLLVGVGIIVYLTAIVSES
jgi:uncharacterized membrane protein YczE